MLCLIVSFHVAGTDHGPAILATNSPFVFLVGLLMFLNHMLESCAITANITSISHPYMLFGLMMRPGNVTFEHPVAVPTFKATLFSDFLPQFSRFHLNLIPTFPYYAVDNMLSKIFHRNLKNPCNGKC